MTSEDYLDRNQLLENFCYHWFFAPFVPRLLKETTEVLPCIVSGNFLRKQFIFCLN